jgi:short subunit dehydrogenase-like uncharacterized protein
LRFVGITASNQRIDVKVTGDRDPGYGATAKMSVEAALELVRVRAQSDVAKGGFYTPASLLGTKLITQLQKYAGMGFEVV